jgi:hypothetical protein
MEQKKAARAARFGITEETDKKAARAERFGMKKQLSAGARSLSLSPCNHF